MGIVALSLCIWVDVAVGENIQLHLGTAACGVDGEKDGPGDAAADEAENARDAQEAKIEVGVERLMLEGVDIGDLPEAAKPVEEAGGKRGRSLTEAVVSMRGIGGRWNGRYFSLKLPR